MFTRNKKEEEVITVMNEHKNKTITNRKNHEWNTLKTCIILIRLIIMTRSYPCLSNREEGSLILFIKKKIEEEERKNKKKQKQKEGSLRCYTKLWKHIWKVKFMNLT
jgi:hypothetical protein